MFTMEDRLLLRRLAISEEEVGRQLRNFREGFPYLDVTQAATVGDGIAVFGGGDYPEDLAAVYDSRLRSGLRVVKFVPASGAATRMFRDLYSFLDAGERNSTVRTVLEDLDGFAFADRLRDVLPADASDRRVIEAIVGPGLEYGSTPKALVLFHKYPDGPRTALEEHLCEAAQYASDGRLARIHFTVSPEHRVGFEELLARIQPLYERRFGIKYSIELSEQDRSTDTIAVDAEDRPFRESDGTLLFRPAGHGALLGNLASIDADAVFVKNIDNVTTDSRRAHTIKYKKLLAGLMLRLQEQVFDMLRRFDEEPSERWAADAADLAVGRLMIRLPADFAGREPERRRDFLRRLLDRPIRVCGMVRNEGEPGGGPFWAVNPDGTRSLQIVEANQIAPQRRHLLAAGTHFNPVDLVCGVRDYRGRRFDLSRYVDRSAGFISQKSHDGRELKAQELPGLWNGSMSDWITVFAQVPLDTFTPVKEITDLLRPAHQPENHK